MKKLLSFLLCVIIVLMPLSSWAAWLTVKKGATSQIIPIPVYDSSSTTGGMLTGLVYNTSSLVCYYNRMGASGSATSISLVTATKGTWTSGGFVAIDGTNQPGWYELDIPDAALASGANSVTVECKGATNMVPVNIIIQLDDNTSGDVYSRIGAPAGASVSADIAAVKTDTAAIKTQTDKMTFTVANKIDSNVYTWNGTAVPTPDTAGYPKVTVKSGSGTGELDVTSGVIKANLAQILGTALTETSGQIAAAFKQFFNIASPTSTMNTITTVTTATNLTNAPTSGDFTATMKSSITTAATSATPTVTISGTLNTLDSSMLRVGTAQAGASGSITLDSGASSTDNLFRDNRVCIMSSTGAGQCRLITGYTGSTKVATVTPNWITNPTSSSVFAIVPDAYIAGNNGNVAGSVGSVTGNVGGNVTGSVGSVTGAVGSVTGNVGGNVTGSIGSLASQAKTDVNTEVANQLNTAIPGSPTANSINERIKTLDDNYTSTRAGLLDHLDADVSSRMATFSLPTNFSSFSIDSSGRVTHIPAESLSVANGTAQAGASGTITLASGASSTDDLYKGLIVKITSGTGAGQARTITGYVGSTKVATVSWNWSTNPDNTSVYSLIAGANPSVNSSLQVSTTASDPWNTALPGSYSSGTAGYIIGNNLNATVGSRSTVSAGDIWDVARSSHTTSGTFGEGVIIKTSNDKTGYTLTSAYDAAKTASQAGDIMKVSSGTGANQISLSSGLVTVGTNNDKGGYSISGTKTTLDALNDITSASVWTNGTRTLTAGTNLNIPSLSSIVSGVWDEAQSGHTTSGTFGKYLDAQISGVIAPSAATVAAAVWDLPISGHTTSGTTGNKLNSAANAGDPWGTDISTGYTGNQAGSYIPKLIKESRGR